MTGAQRKTNAAPFARARDEGYLFRSRALRVSFDAFAEAERTGARPVILSGPNGLGKARILDAYLEERAEAGVPTVSLDACALREGRVAELILAAFGQQPADGAPVRLALHDYIDDLTAESQRPLIAVDNLEMASPSVLLELASLARLPSDGGTGFVLLGATTDPNASEVFSSAPLMLGPLAPDEIKTLLDQVLRSGGLRLELDAGANQALEEQSGGLIGALGPLLDQAVDRCLDDSGQRIERRHVLGQSSRPTLPSASDIEEALLAIGDQETVEDDEIDKAFDELRLPAARSYKPREQGTYPTISEGQPLLPTSGPANDRRPPFNPQVVDALEEVAQTLRHIRAALDTVRDETTRLRGAADQRKAHLTNASAGFAKSLNFRSVDCTEE